MWRLGFSFYFKKEPETSLKIDTSFWYGIHSLPERRGVLPTI
jgi:hypothetical protein